MKPNLEFDRPTLITLTAPTCSGKSYLLDALTKGSRVGPGQKFEPSLSRIVSTTTRSPREGEQDGVDYHFISKEESLELEEAGKFAELVEFRGVRYGVTTFEMEMKMKRSPPPAVVLEPEGVKQYELLCAKNGWDIFKVFVSTNEDVRIERLNIRTSIDIRNKLENIYDLSDVDSFAKTVEALDVAFNEVGRHTDRLLSITGEERRWMHTHQWDAIVPGDDIMKAVTDLEVAVKWRNYRSQNPPPLPGSPEYVQYYRNR